MSGFLTDELSKRTSIFGLRLWVVLGICVGAGIVLVLFLISLWFTSKRNSSKNTLSVSAKRNPNIPKVSKEIQEIRIDPIRTLPENPKLLLPAPAPASDPLPESDSFEEKTQNSDDHQRVHIEIEKGHKIAYTGRVGSHNGSEEARSSEQAIIAVPEVSHLGWGHWYTLRELEISTNYFAEENVIGEGGYGIVYRGVMEDNSRVAVKNLLNNRCTIQSSFLFCKLVINR